MHEIIARSTSSVTLLTPRNCPFTTVHVLVVPPTLPVYTAPPGAISLYTENGTPLMVAVLLEIDARFRKSPQVTLMDVTRLNHSHFQRK